MNDTENLIEYLKKEMFEISKVDNKFQIDKGLLKIEQPQNINLKIQNIIEILKYFIWNKIIKK